MNKILTYLSKSVSLVILISLILLTLLLFFNRFGAAKEFGNYFLILSILLISVQTFTLKKDSYKDKNIIDDQKLKLEWVVVIVSIFFVFRAIFTPGPVIWGDAPYYYLERFKEFTFGPLVWESRGSLGVVNDLYFLYPFMLIYNSLGAFFNFSNDLIIRIVFYLPAILFSSLSPLLFTRYLGFSPLVCLFTVFLYSTSTYLILLIDGGQVGVALAYGIFPLALTSFHKLLNKNTLNQFFISLGSIMLLIIADVRFAIIAVLSFFFWKALENKDFFTKNALKKLRVFGVLFFSAILLSSYWLIPAFFIMPTTGAGIRSSLELISILNPLFLFSPHWPLNMFGKVSSPQWFFAGIPVLIFSSLFFKKDKKVLLLIINFLFFVFLAKGDTGLFGNLYSWLIDHIPLGGAFRDSTKFFAPLILYAGTLIGLSVEGLVGAFKKVIFKKAIVYVVLIYLVALIQPAILGNMHGVLAGRKMPQELKIIAEKISIESSFLRTVWFPERHPLAFSTEEKPALDAKILVNYRPFASLNTGNFDRFNFLHDNQFLQWLDIFGIKYLVFSGDTRQVITDKNTEKDWENLLKLVEDNKEFTKVNWNLDIPIFQTKSHKPRLFTVDKMFAVIGGDDIYQKLLEKDKNFSIGNQGFIFFEDGKFDPQRLQQISPKSLHLIFNQKEKKDLQLSFLSKFFIAPQKATKSQWALRSANDYLSWRFELLVNKISTHEFDFGQGIAFSSEPDELLEFSLNVHNKDDYMLVLRHMSATESNPLEISFSGENNEISNMSSGKFEWFTKKVKLSLGEHKLQIKNNKGFQVINVVGLIPYSEWEKASLQTEEMLGKFSTMNIEDDQFLTLSNWYKINYQMINTGEYDLASLNGYWLVFTDTYHKNWSFFAEGSKQPPYPFYSAVNGFYISKDSKPAKILFTEQENIKYGIGISLLFLFVLISIFLWNNIKNRKKT